MKEKAPSFQFYPKDLMTDPLIISMGNTFIGGYIKLLCYDWLDNGFPNDDAQIWELTGHEKNSRNKKKWLDRLRLKFIEHPEKKGFLTNPRLQKERKKQAKHREISSLGGKQSAKQMATERATKEQLEAQAKSNTSSSSPSSSPKVLKPIKQVGEKRNQILLPKNKKELIFEDRWINYAGEKDNKKKALGHWNAKIVVQEDVDNYDKALLNYYAIVAHDRIKGFPDRRLKGGKTWFNNFESYIDQTPPQEKTADGIEREQQMGEQDLKAKCFSQLEFVKEELEAGRIRDYQWFYMALDKKAMEYKQRFGTSPFFNHKNHESYENIRDEMKSKEEV